MTLAPTYTHFSRVIYVVHSQSFAQHNSINKRHGFSCAPAVAGAHENLCLWLSKLVSAFLPNGIIPKSVSAFLSNGPIPDWHTSIHRLAYQYTYTGSTFSSKRMFNNKDKDKLCQASEYVSTAVSCQNRAIYKFNFWREVTTEDNDISAVET